MKKGVPILPNNHLKYPSNIFPPREVYVKGKKYKLFIARFSSLHNLYDYLKSNPKTNDEIFPILRSVKGDNEISGKAYDEAVEDLIKLDSFNDRQNNSNLGFSNFLKITGVIKNAVKVTTNKYEKCKSMDRGTLNIGRYVAGDLYCFDSKVKTKEPKYIKMYVLMSYSNATRENQILNRAIIIVNLIRALEEAGYNVDLETFELSYLDNEIEQTVIKIKNYGERVQINSLYKILCNVEFFRRIVFRVIETLDLQNIWGTGYGYKCNEEFTRELLKMKPTDIYIDQPGKMGINGYDLYDDFVSVINHLNLSEIINVEQAKSGIKSETMKLSMKK